MPTNWNDLPTLDRKVERLRRSVLLLAEAVYHVIDIPEEKVKQIRRGLRRPGVDGNIRLVKKGFGSLDDRDVES